MGNITSPAKYGSTYDLTHGWLMWGTDVKHYYHQGYSYSWWVSSLVNGTTELHYTKGGKTFGTIPVPLRVREGAQGKCLQALDNGGDIFLAGNSSYIFRNTDSSWERQPDWPELKNGYYVYPDYNNLVYELGGKSEKWYRLAHLLWERNTLTSNSKFHWWPGSEDKLTAKRNFKFGVKMSISQSRWATL